MSSVSRLGQKLCHFDHLIDGIRQLTILICGSFRGADCDTFHCLVVAVFRERLSISK
jgi:hypothetical protein